MVGWRGEETVKLSRSTGDQPMSQMKNDPLQRLRETAWRRRLAPEEEAELLRLLGDDAPARAEWEAELALTGSLSRLPAPVVATNFAARVMEAVRAGQLAEARRAGGIRGWWSRFGWRPRLAVLGGATALVAVVMVQHRIQVQQEVVLGVRMLSPAAMVPSVEWLADFDAIDKLGQVAPTDEDLLAALK